jgi:outer membrane receptor protein involved in Fe transport
LDYIMKITLLSRAINVAIFAAIPVSSLTFAQFDDASLAQDVEKITVTGQKIDRSLQETVNSVAVITANNLEKLNVSTPTDLFQHIPNVHGGTNQGFTIRGIDSFNVSGGGNSYLTSVYFDGAPLPFRMVRTGQISLWDVNQVEIFRGPQSTIQGRNALGGAIVIRSQDPSYEWNAKAKVTLGEKGQKEFALAGGGALIEDQLAFRFSAEKSDFDGYNYNITRQENSDAEENENYRVKLLWEPSFIEDFSALFTYTHDEGQIGAKWAFTNSAKGPRTIAVDEPIFEQTDTDIYTLELSQEINDAWLLDSITTYNEASYGYNWDGDVTPEPISTLTDDRLDITFSQELRLTFEYEAFKGVVGLYYSDLDVDDQSSGGRAITLNQLGVPTLLTAPTQFGGLGLHQALADQVLGIYAPVDPVRLGTQVHYTNTVNTAALFADATYTLNDNIDIIMGFRYDRESQENKDASIYSIDNAHLLPNPIDYAAVNPMLAQLITGLNANLYAQAQSASQQQPLIDEDFSAFLPKLGLSYHFTSDITTSFIYQKGYRSGGVSSNTATARVYAYEPEYTDNYELSFRSTWLENSLVVNVNMFYLDWKDQQINVQLSGNQYDVETRNAGASTVKGFETEVFYFPSDNWSISGGIGYAKTEFTDFEFNTQGKDIVLTGRPFADAPKWTANIATSYHFDNGVYLNLNTNYADASVPFTNPFAIIPNFDPQHEPENDSRVLINGQVGYEWSNYKVWLQAHNLLDKQYIENFISVAGARNADGQAEIGTPRHFSISVQAEF